MKLRIKSRTETYSFDTAKETATIGRSSENDFVIPLDDFSRKQDLGSKNEVIIANIFEFILPNGTSINHLGDTDLELKLETIVKTGRW